MLEARKGAVGGRELDLFLHRANVQNVGLGPEHFEMARHAWRKYGKGNHPAALNLGDCCSYALSKISGEPLLFKGDDFTKIDIAFVSLRLSGGSVGSPPRTSPNFQEVNAPLLRIGRKTAR